MKTTAPRTGVNQTENRTQKPKYFTFPNDAVYVYSFEMITVDNEGICWHDK